MEIGWVYDRYGNRVQQNPLGGTLPITAPQLTVNRQTNRITTAGYAYDASGNLTNDSLHSYTYDAENRMNTVDTSAAAYSYDGSGLRVKKTASGTTTTYIFSGSKVIAEYVGGSVNREYIYAGGKLLATLAGSTTTCSYPDHLSTRVEADANGTTTRTFGHLPFGDGWYETGTASKWKFTTYERDGESALDYATFRYNSSRMGRFATADPLAGFSTNPQTLNRYAYAANDPIGRTDPLGLYLVCMGLFHFDVDGSVTLKDVLWCLDTGSSQRGAGNGRILEQLKKLKSLLELDPDCLAFLGSNHVNPIEALDTIIQNGTYGTFSLAPTQKSTTTNSGGLFGTTTTTTTTSWNNAQAGAIPGQNISVNTEGAFFKPAFKGTKLTTDLGKLKGGTSAAQLFILMHELAHNTEVLEDDFDNQPAVDRNDKRLEQNCDKTIKALGK